MITNKCRIIQVSPNFLIVNPEYAIVFNNGIFIDYNNIRYIDSRFAINMVIQAQAVAENKSNIFTKLREHSDVEIFDDDFAFNKICGVCLECMEDDIVRTLDCEHSFHVNCIEQWFEKKCSCPYCNKVY